MILTVIAQTGVEVSAWMKNYPPQKAMATITLLTHASYVSHYIVSEAPVWGWAMNGE